MSKNISALIIAFIFAVCQSGCSEGETTSSPKPENSVLIDSSITENSDTSGNHSESIPVATEYTDLGTFQYTEQMLRDYE